MRRTILVAFLILIYTASTCLAQRKFVGKILDESGKPVANQAVRVVSVGQGITRTDGTFTIAIPSDAKRLTVQMVSGNLTFMYPPDGVAKVPIDENENIEFFIGESPKVLLTKAIAKSNNDMKSRLSVLGIKQDGIKEALEKYRDEIQKMVGLKLEDLADAEDLDTKKREFYPTLSSAINNYTNEAKDLKDAFKFSVKHAFDDPQALQILMNSIGSYNVAFEDIHKNHSNYEKTVQDLWKSEVKASEVRALFQYALGELHKSNILMLNLKIRDINEYNQSNMSGSEKKALRASLLREVEGLVFQLENRLDELDTRSQILLMRLAN